MNPNIGWRFALHSHNKGDRLSRYLWIALGSAVGGMLRYWMGGAIGQRWGATFPWGTLCVNVLGCTFIGFFAALTAPDGRLLVSTTARQFVMVGLCGGFTTFSSFSLETLNLARDGEWARALLNVLSSAGLCLIGVWLGHVVGKEV